MTAHQRVIKHDGFSGFTAFRPTAWLVTVHTDAVRNSACFISANVIGHNFEDTNALRP